MKPLIFIIIKLDKSNMLPNGKSDRRIDERQTQSKPKKKHKYLLRTSEFKIYVKFN